MKRLIVALAVLSPLAVAHAAAATDAGWPGWRATHTQRLIIQFKDAPALTKTAQPRNEQPRGDQLGDEQAQVNSVESLSARKSLRLNRIREGARGSVVVALPEAVPLDEARKTARLIADDPAVAHVEPDIRVFAHQVNDPLFALQWSLPGPADIGGSAGGINVTAVWPGTTGRGVTVAVIDTGSTSHPDLDENWLPGHDFISADPDGMLATANDGDGRDNDAADPGDWCAADGADRSSSWHGTAVASVIAAQANNGYGIVGAAPGVRILPVRAIGRCGGYMSDVIDAMRWAAGLRVAGVATNPNPAKVLNLSLGSAPDVACSVLQQQAVSEITAANVMIVAAAGNEGAAALGAPANCNHVLAVAAHTRQGELAAYSNFHAAVALTAPGGIGTSAATAILAGSNAGTTAPGRAEPGRTFAGTSAATPHVAAAAALLWSQDPSRTVVEIRNALTSAARSWPAGTACATAAARGRCGAGMLDVAAALRRLAGQIAVAITAPAQTLSGSSAITVTASARSNYAPSQLTYHWTQTSGTPALLAGADAATLQLTLPPFRTTVGLRVTVTDPMGVQTIDDATVNVNNAPVAKEIEPIEAASGEAIVRALGATDPDGDAVRYTVLEGPAGLTVGRSDGRLQWSAAAAGSYAARIAIEDIHGQRGKDIDVEVRVDESLSTASPLTSAGAGGGGTAGWSELALLALALVMTGFGSARRRRNPAAM